MRHPVYVFLVLDDYDVLTEYSIYNMSIMLSPKKEKAKKEENPNLLKPADMYDMYDIYKIKEDKNNLINNEQNIGEERDDSLPEKKYDNSSTANTKIDQNSINEESVSGKYRVFKMDWIHFKRLHWF